MGNSIRNIFIWIIVTILFCMELFVPVIYADVPFEPNVRVNELVLIPTSATHTDPSTAVDSAGNIYIAWRDYRNVDPDIYFAKSTDGGNTFSTNKKVNDDVANAWQFEPSIAVDGPGNIYITWKDDRDGFNGDIYFTISNDGGNTFSPNKKVNDDVANAGQDCPSIAVDGASNIYIVWKDDRNGLDGDIYFAKSTDGGSTFSSNKKVNDDVVNAWQDYPSIAVDGAGNIYIAWRDHRKGNLDIYFAKSTNGGNTFSLNRKVNDDVVYAQQFEPSIAVDGTGNIYITWRDERNGDFDVYFANSTNGGSTFSPNKKVNDDVANAEQFEPSIAVDGTGNIYITWRDERNGDFDIYFAKSTNGGSTFSPNKKVNDDVVNAGQFEPSIAVDGAGNIYITWRDDRNDDFDIYLVISTDGGNTFLANKKVNDMLADARQFEPSIAVDGTGNIYIAWRDNRNGNYDIYFTNSTDYGITFSPDKKVNDDFANATQYTPSIAIDGAGNIYLTWRDDRNGYSDIYFTKSTDGGNTFSTNKKVNDEVVNATQYEPSITVDGADNIYLAWRDDRNGGYDIYFAKSTNGGSTFSPNKKINDDTGNATKFFPSVAVDSVGNIFFAWMDHRNGDHDIYFTNSTDGGNTFSTNKMVNDDVVNATQYRPSIGVGGAGNIYITWADDRNINDDGDIYFTNSVDGGNTFSTNKIVNDDVGNAWQSEPSIAVDSASNLYVAWTDRRNGDLDIYFANSADDGNTFSDNDRVNDDVGSTEQSTPSITVDDAGNIYVAWMDKRNGSSDIYFTKTGPIPAIMITEIKDSPDGNEWVEVYNYGVATINLLDYKISLDLGMTFIDGLWSNPVINFGEYSVWRPSINGVLNDEGAMISIHNFTDPFEPMRDVIGYGQNGSAPDPLTGESSARYWNSIKSKYDTSWSRNGITGPTPGAVNNAPGVTSTPLVIINEVCFYPFLPQYGFIELMYIGDNSRDISNYKIVCDSEFIIPGGTILSKDDPYFRVNHSCYPPGFDLDDGLVNGDNVYLYMDTGALLDMVGWNSPHVQGMSVGRVPDGYGTYQGYDDLTSEAAGWVFNLPLFQPLPPILYINVSQDGEDIILYWDPPSIPGIDHYLIYRSTSQTDFDFNTVWVNTSVDKENGEPSPIPLRTMWNDTNAALPGNITNYQQQYYYTIRTVDTLGKVSNTSRTVGKWTKTFPQGISTFSLPLDPLGNFDSEWYTSSMNAEYIKYLNTTTHTWMQHNLGDGSENSTQMRLGEGYEVKFTSEINYTFCGMPGAMIIYDDGSFIGFDSETESNSLQASVNSAGDVTLIWSRPFAMDSGDSYLVYRSTTRDGFFDGSAQLMIKRSYGFENWVDFSASQPGTHYYYMIVPENEKGIRGSSTYSTGIWTEEYLSEYDTIGIPLKLASYRNADWYCNNIPDCVGINYYIPNDQRWGWHSTMMPAGAFDVVLEMGVGYQISTYGATKFTFVGI